MTDAEHIQFNRGYLLACTVMTGMHDEPGIAADTLAELGISEAEVQAHYNLTEFDQEQLAKIRAAGREDPLT